MNLKNEVQDVNEQLSKLKHSNMEIQTEKQE